MCNDLLDASMSILFRILQKSTKLMICESLPDHRHCSRRKSPARGTRGRVHTGQVVVLMTRAAFDRIDAVAVWPSLNIKQMWVAIISLARIVSAGMTIHAAGMMQYWKNRFEGRSGCCFVP
jgi:hypothetical protein